MASFDIEVPIDSTTYTKMKRGTRKMMKDMINSIDYTSARFVKTGDRCRIMRKVFGDPRLDPHFEENRNGRVNSIYIDYFEFISMEELIGSTLFSSIPHNSSIQKVCFYVPGNVVFDD